MKKEKRKEKRALSLLTYFPLKSLSSQARSYEVILMIRYKIVLEKIAVTYI